MSRWHLVNPMGVSERTTEADSEFWAKRRFVPIPKGWFVCSDASYQVGFRAVKPELLTVCSKCNRHPAVEGRNQCETCAAHKRNGYHRRKRVNPDPTAYSEALRAGHAAMSEEAKAKKAERCRVARLAKLERDRKSAAFQLRQMSIKRGIEQRRAGRTAAAKRERRKPYDTEYNARKREERRAQLSLFGA